MAGRLAGKTAFITAAAQGMGRGAALAFAREGAKVWATDLNAEKLREIEGKDGIRTRVLDVTDQAAVAKVAAEVGDIDVLFNCAGIVHNGTILDCTPEQWEQAFNVNVKSMYLVTRAFLPGMLRKGRGSIINMASVASSIRGLPNRFVYGATKAAIASLTRTWALELGRDGITVNAVAPGPIDTEMFLSANPPESAATQALIATIPMRRIGRPEDVAAAVALFLSDDASFVTGQLLYVCGGLSVYSAPI